VAEVVAVTCAHCGEAMPSGLRVCGECGTSFISGEVASTVVAAESDSLVRAWEEVAAPETAEETSLGELLLREELSASRDAPGLHEMEASAAPVRPHAVAPAAGLGRGQTVLLVAAGVCAQLLVLGGLAFVGVQLFSNLGAMAGERPAAPASAAPTASSTVTLPGYANVPSWSVADVDAAAASGENVLSVDGNTVELRSLKTGEVRDDAEIAGGHVRTVSGFVGGSRAVAAVSDTEALVWVDGADAPLTVSPSGERSLEVRSGNFVIAGPERTFWLLSAGGEISVAAPHAQSIVIGASGDAVIWASAPHQVTVASPNGTAVSDVTLAPPAPDASITPAKGWVRAATASTIVVGWTLADGTTVTGVHSATTGELTASFPGPGDGELSPDGRLWLADGILVNLTAMSADPLPEGFIGSGATFLGTGLYGASVDGGDALLADGADKATSVSSTTVRPFAASAGMLLTLTDGDLSGFALSGK